MLNRVNITGTDDTDTLDTVNTVALARWFNTLKAMAARRDLSNLISTQQAHSPGFIQGLTPQQELEFQINAAWRN